jgi:hypothetical protein
MFDVDQRWIASPALDAPPSDVLFSSIPRPSPLPSPPSTWEREGASLTLVAMSDSSTTLADFRRYAALLDSMIPANRAFTPATESATSIQVERGVVLPRVLKDPADTAVDVVERLIEATAIGAFDRFAIVDAGGHHRPVYRPLLVYCWLQAFRLAYETLPRSQFGRWEEGLRPWCDLLEAELGDMSLTNVAASRGGVAAEAAWTALALHVAGKVYVRDAWLDLAGDTFGRLTRAQQPSGAFLQATASDNPEPNWYHELAILHACASYAVQAEDRTVAAAVARAVNFHVAETQPDHATEQPWGLFAFIWSPSARPLADQLLHSMTISQPAGTHGVPLMLLADALYCLRLFL